MAFHIIKEASFLETLPGNCGKYGSVESERRTGLKRLFGPKAGSVAVSFPEGADRPLFRVTVPGWKGGWAYEWLLLKRCYLAVLEEASRAGCDTLVLPLLAAEDPAFPANIDYKIALETIREFRKRRTSNPLQNIYLLVFRETPVRRGDIERYLYLRESRQQTSRNAAPFADIRGLSESMPRPSPVQEVEESQSLEDAINEWVASQSQAPMESLPEPMDYGSAAEDACYAPGSEAVWEEEAAESAHRRPLKRAVRYDSAPRPAKAPLPKAARRRPNLEELRNRLKKTDAGFSETLLQLIDQTGKKDSEIYNKANVSRQHFSKIRNNPHYKPTKQTAIAFAIALELDLEETKDLIGRAGYTLTSSSPFDLIIMYFIEEGIYDMFDINETLYEFDQSLLGA